MLNANAFSRILLSETLSKLVPILKRTQADQSIRLITDKCKINKVIELLGPSYVQSINFCLVGMAW